MIELVKSIIANKPGFLVTILEFLDLNFDYQLGKGEERQRA